MSDFMATAMRVAAEVDAEQTWTHQAAADREHGIALILEARQQIRNVRISLDAYDRSLSNALQPYQRLLDERLGALLVCREDAS